jgi:hypothetical protein
LFTNINSAQSDNPKLGKSLTVCYLHFALAVSLAIKYLAGDVYVYDISHTCPQIWISLQIWFYCLRKEIVAKSSSAKNR